MINLPLFSISVILPVCLSACLSRRLLTHTHTHTHTHIYTYIYIYIYTERANMRGSVKESMARLRLTSEKVELAKLVQNLDGESSISLHTNSC